jgi:hypothetical protein
MGGGGRGKEIQPDEGRGQKEEEKELGRERHSCEQQTFTKTEYGCLLFTKTDFAYSPLTQDAYRIRDTK